MQGLCYSALSYAPLFIDRTVVVVGDGELAEQDAAELATVAKHVTMVCTATTIAETNMTAKLKGAGNVKVLAGHQVVEVKGDRYANKLVIKDAAGKVSELESEGTFVEMALVPNSQLRRRCCCT